MKNELIPLRKQNLQITFKKNYYCTHTAQRTTSVNRENTLDFFSSKVNFKMDNVSTRDEEFSVKVVSAL